MEDGVRKMRSIEIDLWRIIKEVEKICMENRGLEKYYSFNKYL